MTISLIVFVTLQFYWLKGYYGALEQEFSNKVYTALENTTKTVSELEVDKLLNENYEKFRDNIIANNKQPSLTTISADDRFRTQRSIIYSKNLIEQKQLPIGPRGDSLSLTTLYTDEAAYKIKKDTNKRQQLTSEINQDIQTGDWGMKEYVKFNGTNLPISKRVDAKVLDSILTKELSMKGISANFGYGVSDKITNLLMSLTKFLKRKKKETLILIRSLPTRRQNIIYFVFGFS